MLKGNRKMSHSITTDESNGNNLLSVLPPQPTALSLVTSLSSEDLSHSQSEYTDADESMSAPTEFLAEFLSSVMLKDYKKALKYCKLILQYEPNNGTAKEFYPLIIQKLKKPNTPTTSDSDENDNTPSPNSIEIEIENDNEMVHSGRGSEGSLCSNVTESDYSNSSSDESSEEKDLELEHSNNSNLSNNSGVGASVESGGSDNTTHSYSSLLLEDEDDDEQIQQLPTNYINEARNNVVLSDLKDAFNGNGNYKSTSCSDSESPTEPLTQKIAAILRAKCLPKSAD